MSLISNLCKCQPIHPSGYIVMGSWINWLAFCSQSPTTFDNMLELTQTENISILMMMLTSPNKLLTEKNLRSNYVL